MILFNWEIQKSVIEKSDLKYKLEKLQILILDKFSLSFDFLVTSKKKFNLKQFVAERSNWLLKHRVKIP